MAAEYRETIEKTFAAVSDLYAQHWNEFFHFALFETEDETWEEAFERTHAKYVEALRLEGATNVLEIACGRGGFSAYLARATSARVLGIDLSPEQLAHAGRHRAPNLRFRQHDVMHVDELGESFDAVVCMDAACYFPDKRRAVEKIAKVVNPGGRFLLVDWCKQDGLNRLQEELVLGPFMKLWAIPSLATARNYETYLERSGFEVVELSDLNDQVRPNWELGYERALSAVRELTYEDVARMIWRVKRLGPEGWRILKDQFPAALYIKAGFDAGFLRYTYIVAERKERPD